MKCIVCNCTDEDCHECIEITGKPCRWVGYVVTGKHPSDFGLCSACVTIAQTLRKSSRKRTELEQRKRRRLRPRGAA